MSTVYGHPVQQRLRRCGVVSGDATPSPSYRIRTLNPDTLATGGGAWYDSGNTATVQRRLVSGGNRGGASIKIVTRGTRTGRGLKNRAPKRGFPRPFGSAG